MQKISRRRFLSLCAGAVVLGGGWVLARGRILPELRDRTAAALGRGRVTYLRQIVAQDNAAARTIMWQSPASLVAPAVELTRGEAAETQRFPAEEEAFTEDGVTVYLYTAQVTGLERGARYRYRVAAGEERGGWTLLQADDGGAFRALIFPDSQSSDYAGWRELAQMARQRNPDARFFINMGDLVDNGEDHTQWNAWLDGVEGIIDTIPIAPLMGNHETYDKQWQVREPVAYLREFALPGNGSKEYDRRYYSFDYGPVHFLVLDTQQGEEQERHPHITEAQEAWFRSDVQRTRQPWKVVLMHKDPLQYRIHGRPERGEGFSEEGKLWMPLFDAAGIDLVLSAHLHTYRNRGHIKGFERSAEGPLYVLTGVAGDVRYPGLWVDHAVDEVVAPQPETDNYLTLDADEDMLIVRCFLPDGTQIDEAAVKKT